MTRPLRAVRVQFGDRVQTPRGWRTVMQARNLVDGAVEFVLSGVGQTTMTVPASSWVRVERGSAAEDTAERPDRPGSGIAYHPTDRRKR